MIDIILLAIVIVLFIIIIYQYYTKFSAQQNTIQDNNKEEHFAVEEKKDIKKKEDNNTDTIKKNKKNINEENRRDNRKENRRENRRDNRKENRKENRSNNKKENNNKKKIKDKMGEDLVYFDIYENNKELGKIIIKLFSEVVPYTCENFRELCRTKKYANSPFHRIIKDFMIQGGDYTRGDGTGGVSIYGDKFEDENFEMQHDQPYLLSMANAGPNTNGSQFFITTNETHHLDGKHVVFGCIYGGHDIIDYLNMVDTNEKDKPISEIIIKDCGIYK